MKKTLLLIFLITSLVCAQERPDFFLKKTIDVQMAINGPGYSYENINSSYNPEFALGFEWENTRVYAGFEDHDVIDYFKLFGGFDPVKLNWWRFNFYAGAEVSVIWRKYYFDLVNFPGVTVTDTEASFSAGFNFETQFKITDCVWLTTNFNPFTTEGGSSEKHEFFRWDVMAGIVVKIPYTL